MPEIKKKSIVKRPAKGRKLDCKSRKKMVCSDIPNCGWRKSKIKGRKGSCVARKFTRSEGAIRYGPYLSDVDVSSLGIKYKSPKKVSKRKVSKRKVSKRKVSKRK